MKYSKLVLFFITLDIFPSVPQAATRKTGTSLEKPNILLFFPDQFRSDWTSMNPNMPDVTPNLKKLAQDGVWFSSALSPSPLCAPARACIALGKRYDRSGVLSNGNALPLNEPTFYKLLRDSAGYVVLGCGKFDLDKPGASWGLNGKHDRDEKPSLLNVWGFTDGIDNAGKADGEKAFKKNIPEPYFAYLKKKGEIGKTVTDESYCDNWIARNGIQLLKSVPAGKPWFLQINFNGPHGPYDPTPEMLKKWDKMKFPAAVDNDKDANDMRQRYSAEVYNIDRWIKRYIDFLKERNELDNTIIVFCSDHGDMLGDHGVTGKDRPQTPSVGVPLIISGPGIKKGLVNSKPATTLDLTATFLDFANLKVPTDMDSKSLKSYLLTGKGYSRQYVTSSRGYWRLVFDGRFKLVDNQKSHKTLYDLENDPAELVDVSDKYPQVVKHLDSLLPPWFPRR